eukprot:TRINITY_DN91117_c0_g1_i1.p1 TRINITY_DN91117_c0_g1~~TRINITY_DN91117_c0_g1_i1.p1  ORF type:complete len:573 (-),score=105.12 TRINITY_DN91117_c0_g1_i1:18-1622(-)
MTEIRSVNVGNLRKPGEVGLQESDLLDRMPDGAKAEADSATDAVRLISLGCFCGPKLSFKKIGRGAETLPFDWVRTRLDGIFHFLRNDFQGFYDWSTKQWISETRMTIYRGFYHSFWHDNPTDPHMHERYNRRIVRFKEIDARSAPVLFVRTVAVSDELQRAGELLAELKAQFGPLACLLMIVDFQRTANGPATVRGYPDLLVWYLSGEIHNAPDADGAPYTEPVSVALNWAVGRAIAAMDFVDLETIVNCTDPTDWGMTGLAGVAAFESELRRPDAAIAQSFEVTAAAAPTGSAEWRSMPLFVLGQSRLVDQGLEQLGHTCDMGPLNARQMTSAEVLGALQDSSNAEVQSKLASLKAAGKQFACIRVVSDASDFTQTGALLGVLRRQFGDLVALVIVVDGQPATIGPMVVDGADDLLVYFQGAEKESNAKAASATALQLSLDWVVGKDLACGSVGTFSELYALAREVDAVDASAASDSTDSGKAFDSGSGSSTWGASSASPAIGATAAKPDQRSDLCCYAGLRRLFGSPAGRH